MGKEIEHLEKKIEKNANKIKNNEEKILKNTGALELLHTINDTSKMFFRMWLVTFATLIITLIGFITYAIVK